MKVIILILTIALIAVGVFWYRENYGNAPTAEPVEEEVDQKDDRLMVQLGDAHVDNITLTLLESFPVQVRAIVFGSFPDSCTGIGEISQTKEANLIRVRLLTLRPKDALCAQVITSFEHTISIDVFGLKKGTYTVEVNGATDTFILEADNGEPVSDTAP